MPTRRSILRGLPLLLPTISGCSTNRSPTTICTVSFLNWDRERHRFHVQIVAEDTTLWEQQATVPARTDDVIPGPQYEDGLPDQHSTYTIRAKIDDTPWTSLTVGKDNPAVELNIHAEEDGQPGIWQSPDCQTTTTEKPE